MQVVRIIGVWLITLLCWSWYGGRGSSDGFRVMFMVFGLFMTIPVLIALAIACLIETALVLHESRALAISVGPVMGLIVPLLLTAADRNKTIGDAVQLFPITLGAGVLWAVTFPLLRRNRLRQIDDDNVDSS